MSDIPIDDKPGFVAEKPEHCFACNCLIRPGQTYYLTIEGIVLCEDCTLSEDVIRVREDLQMAHALHLRDDLLQQRRPNIEAGSHWEVAQQRQHFTASSLLATERAQQDTDTSVHTESQSLC